MKQFIKHVKKRGAKYAIACSLVYLDVLPKKVRTNVIEYREEKKC